MPGSIRRTSSIDISWPRPDRETMRLVGRARDLATPASGPAFTCAEDRVELLLDRERSIQAIECEPPRAGLAQLLGKRAGGHLRQALAECLPQERLHSTPLYLLLDDLSGASLVAQWAWMRWNHTVALPDVSAIREQMEGVCIGYAPGSSVFRLEDPRSPGVPVPPLAHPHDAQGWHAFSEYAGPSLRRARRIDIHRDTLIRIDASFQDSASTPEGMRVAVHEYSLRASADPVSLELLSVEATPHVLPLPECPSATGNLPRLLGLPLPELREQVIARLRKTAGCTHLNDALRALADVPALLRHLA